jgi:hypothetical protein
MDAGITSTGAIPRSGAPASSEAATSELPDAGTRMLAHERFSSAGPGKQHYCCCIRSASDIGPTGRLAIRIFNLLPGDSAALSN